MGNLSANRVPLSEAALFPQLDRALAYRLTLLVAPAGSGKTTLLRRWVDARSWPSAWLTLDELCNTLPLFSERLAAALQTIQPDIKRALSAPFTETPEDRIIGLINALAGFPDDFTLILDNYEVIDASPVRHSVELLLDYPPPCLHMIICSRAEPALPLARLQVRRQLLRLRLDFAQTGA